MNQLTSDPKYKDAAETNDAGNLSLEPVHDHDEIEGSEFLDDTLRMKEQSLQNSNDNNNGL
jgi:hypothetical protein